MADENALIKYTTEKDISILWDEFRVDKYFDFNEMTGISKNNEREEFSFKCKRRKLFVSSYPKFEGKVISIGENLSYLKILPQKSCSNIQMLFMVLMILSIDIIGLKTGGMLLFMIILAIYVVIDERHYRGVIESHKGDFERYFDLHPFFPDEEMEIAAIMKEISYDEMHEENA